MGEFTAEIVAAQADHPAIKGLKPFTTTGRNLRAQAAQPGRSHRADGARRQRRPRALHVGAHAGQGPRVLHGLRPRRADVEAAWISAADSAGHGLGGRRCGAQGVVGAEDAGGAIRRRLRRAELREPRSGAEVSDAVFAGRRAEVRADAGGIQAGAVRERAADRQADPLHVRRTRPPLGDRSDRLSEPRAARRHRRRSHQDPRRHQRRRTRRQDHDLRRSPESPDEPRVRQRRRDRLRRAELPLPARTPTATTKPTRRRS